MKSVFGATVLVVGLAVGVWSGVVYDTGYVLQPSIHHHHVISSPREVYRASADGSGGYAASGGYSNSFAALDSFADPKNRGPEVSGPKPVYGPPAPGPALPELVSAATSSGDSSSSSSSSDDSDFNAQDLDADIRQQDPFPGAAAKPSTTTTTEAPIEDDEEIEFVPPMRSLFQRFFSFVTKQFSNIFGFLRRIWNRIRGGSST